MTTPKDIIRQIESWTGHPLNGDEGVLLGDSARPLDWKYHDEACIWQIV